MMNSQRSLKELFSICMTNIEMNQFMLKNGWLYADNLSYICFSNGTESKDLIIFLYNQTLIENNIKLLKEMYSH